VGDLAAAVTGFFSVTCREIKSGRRVSAGLRDSTVDSSAPNTERATPPAGEAPRLTRLGGDTSAGVRGPSASAKMPIEHPIRWEPMAHRTGCPIGTDGRPMGILARLHRATPGTIGESHETSLTDSSFLTNQKRGILELLQDA